MIPNHPFCAPADLTDDIDIVKACIASQDSAVCIAPCQWREGLNADGTTTDPSPGDFNAQVGVCKWNVPAGVVQDASNPGPCNMIQEQDACNDIPNNECSWEFVDQGPPALFTEEFCHPVKMNKETTEQDLTQCIGKSATECPAPCVFNNGAELIPDNEFCAP
jgi:hypothetical protein